MTYESAVQFDTDIRIHMGLAVRNLERSVAFYRDRVGFHLDHDVEPGNGFRVVQLTPPGSACSIVIGVGMSNPEAPPVLGLHLVVARRSGGAGRAMYEPILGRLR